MSSDFTNMKEAGKSCMGCGRTGDKVQLKRLSTYSRSYACVECVSKEQYRKCANKNPLGVTCNHEVHLKGPCQHCGCQRYIHGLESEHDRQLAACVGQAPAFKYCQSFGANLGKCGKVIMMGPGGEIPRLCTDCMADWVKAAIDGEREARTRGDLDASTDNPSGILH